MKKKFKITLNAPITLTFVFICFLATLAGVITSGFTTRFLFSTYHSSLASPMTYLRFFTHVFGHGDWAHFVGNASYLLLLGPILEEKYGPKIMLATLVTVSLMTGLINYIFFRNVALCGASGVVFAFILLASFTGFHDGELPLTFLLVAVIYLGQQLYEGIFIRDHISNMAHIIGGIIGALLGYFQNKKPASLSKKSHF